MEWINIKEQKPPYKKMVLISTIGDKTQTPPPRLTPHIAARISTDANGENWITDAADKPVGEVTHWMPLPDNPRDGNTSD
jgi:hypothetical protein